MNRLSSLAPQMGLVPLGPDPASGLWEFGHLMTGEPPERDLEGRLILTEQMGVVLVLVPGGSFWMGAQNSDAAARNHDPRAESSESPVHEVELSAFFLSKYEMTQSQWLRFTGTNPSRDNPQTYARSWNRAGLAGNLMHPVERVSWFDCVERLDLMGLALPSEAQWEYGARGGTSSVWWTGNEKESLRGAANLADRYLDQYGGGVGWVVDDWLDDGNTSHARVGSYAANGFGLFDVHGNVWEWCVDGYDQEFYDRKSGRNPVHVATGSTERVNRGGGYSFTAVYARAANRYRDAPALAIPYLGVRPARAIEPWWIGDSRGAAW